MHRARGVRLLGLLSVVALVVTLAMTTSVTAPAAVRRGSRGPCPVDALKDGQKVTLTFWYAMQRSNEDALVALLDQFEAEHPEITVDAINQTTYPDVLDKYTAGLATGDLPDVAQFEETTVQQLLDSHSTIFAADCVEADDYPLDDFLPRALDYYTTENVLRAMPWTISNPVVIFNRGLIESAGIDPEKAPATFDELRAYA